MAYDNFLNSFNKIHFVGIGGISMSALASYCLFCGKSVSGSDNNLSEITEKLQSEGATVYYNHFYDNPKNCDLIVYSSAIKSDNPELLFAREHGIPVMKRSEFLAKILSRYKKVIAVSGSHGKTTCSAIIYNILKTANLSPTAFIGGESSDFLFTDGDYAVVEACEYQKNFLDIKPNYSVVLNIDDDHLDTFGNIENEISAFNEFIKNTVCFINADDENSKTLFNDACVYFGIKNPATYSAKGIRRGEKGYGFDLYYANRKVGRIKLNIFGYHNIYNALASVAVCHESGVSFPVIKKGIESFYGIKRRNEFIGKIGKVKCFSDYAHHPCEINATISEYSRYKTLFVFQPHTYSRTKLLFKDFTSVLSGVDNLIIYATYPARESFDLSGDAYTLFKAVRSKRKAYYDDTESLKDGINALIGDCEKIVFLGAGDIYERAKKIIQSFNP